ncbi:MAG TPA: DUF1684 domain-containing protein [Candidatus Didemnitutus sp.]|nr:DUF1684 domain-containing protein [Candidatus Didemnitutus sp.]
MSPWKSLGLGLLVATSAVAALADDDYTRSVEAWRADRKDKLTKPDGWLTLTGLFWLRPGENTVGAAPDNTIHLTSGPAHFGTVVLEPGNVARFKPWPKESIMIDQAPAAPGVLRHGGGLKPSYVQSGTVTFYVIEHGTQLGLRVKDSEAPRRLKFAGIDYFPIDPAWRVEAKWVPFDSPRTINFADVLGQTQTASVPGEAVVTLQGRTFALLPIDEGKDRPLFFVIGDATNGGESHGGGRFLYTEWPKDGKVTLDFNHLENPPCAFSPFTICPLPPKDNQLPFPVPVGEKAYRGEGS